MNRNRILGILLAIQVLAAFIYLLSGNKLQSHAGITRLLNVEADQVNRLVIEDSNGSVAELIRNGEAWQTSDGFPVDTDRIQNLLQDVSELDHGLAVATTPAAATRFKVAENDFERHVKLFKDKSVLGEFYLGSGAGARRNHIRLAGDSSIFVAELATYSIPGEIGDWQDKEQLQLEADAVTSIVVDGIAFNRSVEEPGSPEPDDAAAEDASEWTTANLAEDEILDQETLVEQLGNLAGIRYELAFTGSLEESAEDPGQPARTIILSYADQNRTYQFYKAKDADNFILKVSDRDELFEISQYTGNRIIENLNRDALVQKPEPDPPVEEPATTNEPENTMPWMPGN